MQTLSSYLVQWSPLGSQWCNCVQRPKNLQSDIRGKSLSLCVGSSPSALSWEPHLIKLCFPYSGWLIPLSPCHCIWRHPHRHTHECACVNYSSHHCDVVALWGKDWFGLQLKWIQSQCTGRKSTGSRAELSKL